MTTPDDNTVPEPAEETAQLVEPGAVPTVADELPAVAPEAPSLPATPPPPPTPYAPTPPAPGGYTAPPAPPQAYAAPATKPNTWMNIVSLVTALLGMAIIPVIFGHLGVSASNKGKADLKGLGIAGLIIGYLEIAFWILFWALVIGGTIASNNT